MSLISVYAGERRIVDYACIALAGAVLAAFFAVGLYGTAVGFVQTMAYFKANDVVSLVCGFIAAGCALYLVLELTSERRGRVVLAICVVCGPGLICGPWFWLMYHRAPDYLAKTVGHHVATPIFSSALEGHGGPPGYYLLMVWPMFLPWSWLLGVVAVKSWRNRRLLAVAGNHLTPLQAMVLVGKGDIAL